MKKKKIKQIICKIIPPKMYYTLFLWKRHILCKLRKILTNKFHLDALNMLVLERNKFTNNIYNNFCYHCCCPMIARVDDRNLPSIDITVVTYNSEKWVNKFIESIIKLEYPYNKLNVIFVDNNSNDNTLNLLNAAIKKLQILGIKCKVISQLNKGYGAGNNVGIAAGISHFCLVTNIDLEFEPFSLIKAVSHAVSDTKDAVAWEFRQKPYEHPKIYDPVTGTTNWNSHACVLLRRSAIEFVGGYDENIFMYGEDVELSYRFRSKGFKLRYNPHAVVYHYTYETPNEIKTLQFEGSIFANLYIRLKYGKVHDIFLAFVMFLKLLFAKSLYLNFRITFLKNICKLLFLTPKFLLQKKHITKDNKNNIVYPFCGWDYDFAREGAFYPVQKMPKNKPKVSVITRTIKGRGKFLLQAMISVANQTYPNIEHIISEDNGQSAKDLVNNFAKANNKNIKYVSCMKGGRSATGNAGLAQATGKWCIFLDDDDLYFCEHIEVLVSALQSNESANAAYSYSYDVPTNIEKNENGDIAYREYAYIAHDLMRGEFSHKDLRSQNVFSMTSVLFDRNIYLEYGGFDEELDVLEDWYIWQKYTYKKKFICIPKTTSYYRTPYEKDEYINRAKIFMKQYNKVISLINDWCIKQGCANPMYQDESIMEE